VVNRQCTLLCVDGLEVLQLLDNGIYMKFLDWLYSLISCQCTMMPSVSKMKEKNTYFWQYANNLFKTDE
jgi:hypothetical protein